MNTEKKNIKKITGTETEKSDSKIFVMVPIIGIIIAEILIFYRFIFYGLGLHIVNLIVILFLIFSSGIKIRNILQSIVLLILIRMIYLSMPPFFKTYLQYILILAVILIPIYLTIKCQQCQPRINTKGRFDFKDRNIYIMLSVLTGSLLDALNSKIMPSDIYLAGELITVFLIICLSITLLLPDKYLDKKYISESLNICSIPVWLTFMAILIFRIISL